MGSCLLIILDNIFKFSAPPEASYWPPVYSYRRHEYRCPAWWMAGCGLEGLPLWSRLCRLR